MGGDKVRVGRLAVILSGHYTLQEQGSERTWQGLQPWSSARLSRQPARMHVEPASSHSSQYFRPLPLREAVLYEGAWAGGRTSFFVRPGHSRSW